MPYLFYLPGKSNFQCLIVVGVCHCILSAILLKTSFWVSPIPWYSSHIVFFFLQCIFPPTKFPKLWLYVGYLSIYCSLCVRTSFLFDPDSCWFVRNVLLSQKGQCLCRSVAVFPNLFLLSARPSNAVLKALYGHQNNPFDVNVTKKIIWLDLPKKNIENWFVNFQIKIKVFLLLLYFYLKRLNPV